MWTPLQRPVQRSRVQHVALDDLGAGLHTGPHLLRAAGQAAQPHPLLFQQRDQPTADVAAAASEQDQGPVFIVQRSPSVLIPRSESPSCCAFYGLPVLKIAGAVWMVFEGCRCFSCADQRRKRSGHSWRRRPGSISPTRRSAQPPTNPPAGYVVDHTRIKAG